MFRTEREAKIIDAVEANLLEFYTCLNDTTLAAELCSVLVVPNTGNDQLDYENVRDQLERMAKVNEPVI